MTTGANIEAALRQSQTENAVREYTVRRKLENDLTEVVATQLCSFDVVEMSPVPIGDIAMGRYRTDAVFHAKVDSMVSRVMGVVRNSGLGI